MKRLIVLRHAKSSWKDRELDDFDRPLNKRGKKDAPAMGRRLAQRGLRPDLVVTSPARRARDTVDAVAEQFAPGDPLKIVEDRRLYEASRWDILEVLHGFDDARDCIMIVGHNPGLTDFIKQFAYAEIDNIPTCGVAEIEFDVTSWAQAGKVAGRIVRFDTPKKEP